MNWGDNFLLSDYTTEVIFCKIFFFYLSFSFGLNYFFNTLAEIAEEWEEGEIRKGRLF